MSNVNPTNSPVSRQDLLAEIREKVILIRLALQDADQKLDAATFKDIWGYCADVLKACESIEARRVTQRRQISELLYTWMGEHGPEDDAFWADLERIING